MFQMARSLVGTALERNLATVDETRSSLMALRTSLEGAAETGVAELRAQDAHEQQLRARRDQLEEQRRVLTYQRDALQIEVRAHAEECNAAYRDKDALDAKFLVAVAPPSSSSHADAVDGTPTRLCDFSFDLFSLVIVFFCVSSLFPSACVARQTSGGSNVRPSCPRPSKW
jgi:hypothetical protein